jgi:hypothetical protein
LGAWLLYEFKAGTMTYIDVILQDVGGMLLFIIALFLKKCLTVYPPGTISAINLWGMTNITKYAFQGPLLGTWQPDMV